MSPPVHSTIPETEGCEYDHNGSQALGKYYIITHSILPHEIPFALGFLQQPLGRENMS